MTAMLEVGYDYVLSFEHEDPVMSEEDGAEQNIQFLRPLIIKKFGTRIFHAHAKDWELQKDILHVDGVTGTGSWQRSDRAARYRVPGWGDVEWRRVMTAMLEVGYDYVLSFEHEDPVMSEEDGAEQNIQFLKPLVIKKPLVPGQAWWLA